MLLLKIAFSLIFLNFIFASSYFNVYNLKPVHNENSKHFLGVNPNAPKGGKFCFAVIGSYDHLNPFIVIGNSPVLLNTLCFARLLESSPDELFTNYPYLAKTIEISADRKIITFNLFENATFSDGSPITAHDVEWSFEYIKSAHPKYKSYYHDIESVKVINDHKIQFVSKNPNNKEIPAILGQIFILSKKYFTKNMPESGAITEPFPVSGPYLIKSVDHGKTIVFERIKNWWGEKVISNVGFYNFDIVKVDYYRERNAAFQAFLSGDINLWIESSAKQWHTAYNVPAVAQGKIKKEILKTGRTPHTRGFVFNLRKSKFKDIKVRKAITLLFNFHSLNRTMFYNEYELLNSYYGCEELAHKGEPIGEELSLLEPFKHKLPKEVFGSSFENKVYNSDFIPREIVEEAIKLLKESGWEIKDHTLVNNKGEKFEIVIPFVQSDFEKIILHIQRNLQTIGIKVVPKQLDSSSYTEVVNQFDYDMCYLLIPQSYSLGNEQKEYFGSKSAKIKGSKNLAGIENEVVDSLINTLINSQSYESMLSAAHAIDRVLCWNYYMIMGWDFDGLRIAYQDIFERPQVVSKYSPIPMFSWWCKTENEAKIKDSSFEKNESIFSKIKKFLGMN